MNWREFPRRRWDKRVEDHVLDAPTATARSLVFHFCLVIGPLLLLALLATRADSISSTLALVLAALAVISAIAALWLVLRFSTATSATATTHIPSSRRTLS
jgi:hypothetical protein